MKTMTTTTKGRTLADLREADGGFVIRNEADKRIAVAAIADYDRKQAEADRKAAAYDRQQAEAAPGG